MEMSLDNLPFGKRLKVVRVAQGLSQADVAQRVGISENRLCKFETGRAQPRPDELGRLRRLFNAPL